MTQEMSCSTHWPKRWTAAASKFCRIPNAFLRNCYFPARQGRPRVDGVLELNPITEEPVAPATGTATVARVLTRTGAEVLSCDVGDRNSDAVIKLTTITITAGGPVRLDSFQLSMPD